MRVNTSRRKKRRRALTSPSLCDVDLISDLFEFANRPGFSSQEEVYEIAGRSPYTPRQKLPDGSLRPYIQRIHDKQGVEPFLRDQSHLRKLLRDLANRSPRVIEQIQSEVSEKLREKLKAFLKIEWTKGALQVRGEPVIDGLEIFYYYPLALLFHYNLQHRVKICETILKEEKRQCGKFYLANKKHPSACSPDHQSELKKQKAVRRVQRYYEKFGRSPEVRVAKRRTKAKK